MKLPTPKAPWWVWIPSATAALAWLLGSAVAWDIYPGNWAAVGRFILAFLWLIGTAFALIGYYCEVIGKS